MMPCRRCVVVALLASLALAGSLPGSVGAQQAPPLSPAQVALFETPHLDGIRAPIRLDYVFRREEAGRETVEDRITLEIRAVNPDGRHDVHPEFLTGERRIPYPSALGFRGNPLPMFALDRDTRELAAATGGSAIWFRGRVRQALVDQATLRETTLQQPGGAAAIEIELAPFRDEPRAGRYQERRYYFILSEAVPGGIVEIRTSLPAGEGRGAVSETILYAGSRPQ